ncbi:MAG: flagellar hook-basal body complex protein FliE [Pseudomonadales bacterium]
MSDMQIQQVLASMRALQAKVPVAADVAASPATGAIDFGSVLRKSLSEVNAAQQTASQMATRFQQGDPSVSLPDVMISMQKSSLHFEAATQVRNRLIAAYQEIMNMQV